MKNTIIVVLLITFVASFCGLQKYDEFIDVSEVNKIINIRSNIINDFMYNNHDLVDLKNKLSEIECGDILKKDIELLTYIYNNPTEYRYVKKSEVTSVKKFKKVENTLFYKAEITWYFLGENEFCVETKLIKDYNIICKVKNDKVFLTNLEIVQ